MFPLLIFLTRQNAMSQHRKSSLELQICSWFQALKFYFWMQGFTQKMQIWNFNRILDLMNRLVYHWIACGQLINSLDTVDVQWQERYLTKRSSFGGFFYPQVKGWIRKKLRSADRRWNKLSTGTSKIAAMHFSVREQSTNATLKSIVTLGQ